MAVTGNVQETGISLSGQETSPCKACCAGPGSRTCGRMGRGEGGGGRGIRGGLTLDERFNELYYGNLEAQETRNGIGLTKEQMLEDYDYLYWSIRENWPYVGVARRKAGAGLDASYKEGRMRLEAAGTDVDFYIEVSKLVDSMKGIGHLSVYDPYTVSSEVRGYKQYQDSGQWPEELVWYRPWIADWLSDPVVRNESAWKELLKASFSSAYDQTMEEFGIDQGNAAENVHTEIIEEGKTAYLSIAAFDMDSYDEDKEILFDFYRQVADYDNLIIDITENGGGGMPYYMNLIVAPNTEKDLCWLNYVFVKDGEINRKYNPDLHEVFFSLDTPVDQIREQMLKSWSGRQREAVEPLLEHIGVPEKMNQEDLKELDLYAPDVMYIESLNGERMFQGKIWVLVSGNVYSSSESFASFCKTTGWAALVGTRTGGDGIGSDPLMIVLPNSGLVGRYAWIYGTVQDGTGSEEFGTEPDYISGPGESALETCLRLIRENGR